ncbi:hypothetical protein D8Y23_09100 [Microbacterium enclense]|uniref:Uncharacterized protein n=1 Tax=Microbacterium enclense TaxID=993073 RepID=A0A3S3P3V9_9MICO|nr:hypothetical protein [Microbacterium enclense]RWR18667.1 hypothetical protein D8Y23_09100 [Microbacterium enclense]
MSAVTTRRESWVRSYAAPFTMRIAVVQTACALALLAAAGIVALLSADAIAQSVAAGAALVAAVVLLAAVIGSMLHLAALRMLPRFPVRDGGGPARPSAAVLERIERHRSDHGETPPEPR